MVTSLPEVSVRPNGKGNGVSKVMIQPSNRSSGRNLSGMIVWGSRMRAEGPSVGVGRSRVPGFWLGFRFPVFGFLGYGCIQCLSGSSYQVSHDPMVISLPEVSVRPRGKENEVSKVIDEPVNKSSG